MAAMETIDMETATDDSVMKTWFTTFLGKFIWTVLPHDVVFFLLPIKYSAMI